MTTPASQKEIIDQLHLLASLESMSPTEEMLYDACIDLLRDSFNEEGKDRDYSQEDEQTAKCS